MADVNDWTPRRLGVTVTAAVAAAATIGLVVGRLTAPSEAPSAPKPVESKSPTVAPSPSPGVPTSPPVTVAGGLPGAPTRLNSLGIPVGYPHTEAGAISACANYVSAYGDPRNREPSQLRRVLDSIATNTEAARLTTSIVNTDKANAKTLGVPSVISPQVNFNIRVIGYRVLSSSQNTVSAAIWSGGGFGVYGSENPSSAARLVWGTDNCTVTWSSNDWKLSKAVDGPTGPVATDQVGDSFSSFAYVGGFSQ